MTDNSATTLYRFYDQEGTLLYIGIAVAPFARFAGHKADKRWWADVARIELANYDTRESALRAEAAAIRAEVPRFNVIHHPRPICREVRRSRFREPYDLDELIELDDDLNPVSKDSTEEA